MRKLILFNMVTADGYFKGHGEDINWHRVDQEVNEYIIEQLRTGDTFLFGRKTYTLMEDYWTGEDAFRDDPVVTELMRDHLKIIISNTLKSTNWKNTRLVSDHIIEEVQQLKKSPGKIIFLCGSGELSELLLHHGLIDEIRLIINPVTLGAGVPLFKNSKLNLQLLKAKVFGNGNIMLDYIPG